MIPSNDKKYSRIAAIEAVVDQLARDMDLTLPTLEPAFEAKLRDTLNIGSTEEH